MEVCALTRDMLDSDKDIPQNTNHHHEQQSYSNRRLVLISFSHRRGPLVPQPSPGLRFDVRSLPNPSKRLRQLYTGAHKVLREDFMSNEAVRMRVDDMSNAINAYLAGLDEGGAPDAPENYEDQEVRVGICCELGRHRSVACVEELARNQWPEGWTVSVIHRDLSRRSERNKEKRSRKVEAEADEE